MRQYVCDTCKMAIENLICSQCKSELELKPVTKEEGLVIQVSECPKGCGKIKSPMCCGHDMILVEN